MCLLMLLCACSTFYMPQYNRAYYMPTQPSICHNTAEPTVYLLSLLYATIQPSLLCACPAIYMPQYSRAYCMPAHPSICHNTAEPIVCLLSLLYATIQSSPCNTLPAYPSRSCSLTIHSVYYDIILANLHSYAAIQ